MATKRLTVALSSEAVANSVKNKLGVDSISAFINDFIEGLDKHTDFSNVLERHAKNKKDGKTLGERFADSYVNQQRDVVTLSETEALALLETNPTSKKPGMLNAKVIKAVEAIKTDRKEITANRIHMMTGCNRKGVYDWVAANKTMVDSYNATLL
jgi:hypothetical protein